MFQGFWKKYPSSKKAACGPAAVLFKSNCSPCLSEGAAPNSLSCFSLKQRRRERNARLEPVQVTHCTGATQATAVANWAELKCCRCVMVFPNTSWELDSHHAATSALTVGTRGPAVIGQSGGILEEKPRGFLRSTAHYNETSAINPSADYHAKLILSYFLPPSIFLCVVVFLLLF